MQRRDVDLLRASEADSWLWELACMHPSIFYGRVGRGSRGRRKTWSELPDQTAVGVLVGKGDTHRTVIVVRIPEEAG
jgi:hypothetical protein